ncbi:MAG: DUF502 domain-containing protein [Marinicella sp.]
MKNWLIRPILKGALVTLPILITAWIAWSALKWLNGLGLAALTTLHMDFLTFPGSGLIIMLVLLFLVGWLLKFSFIDWFYQRIENTVMRFPVIKTLYGAVKDFANMFDKSKDKNQQVALVDLHAQGMGMMIGIITSDQLPTKITDVVNDSSEGKLLTVYIPMSYMVGGFTMFLPENKVKPVDWSFEEAMRFALTAGVSQDTQVAPTKTN